jgi:Flp pilus assembly protein TadD
LSPEEELAKNLEIQGINAANSSDFDKALELFNQAISIAPKRASGFV